MQSYKLIIAYDGTDYAGWQIQPNRLSVAEQLQNTFYEVFKKKIILYGVSRTDAGVHALGQVATFKTDLNIDVYAMHKAWNARLPMDISIRSLEHVEKNFNPHAHILYKTYMYHFFLERPLPMGSRYGIHVCQPINLEKLKRCLDVFVGTHDFRSFCTGDEHEDTVRIINAVSLTFVPEYNVYRIAVSGPKFLRYMIRRIVGAALCVASKSPMPISVLQETLEAKNPEHTLPKAAAKGLMLYEVVYEIGLSSLQGLKNE